jgi:glutathione S-transferase
MSLKGLISGLYRATNVLAQYRGFQLPPSAKFKAWLDRLFNHSAFKSTCSSEDLYIDSYERFGILKNGEPEEDTL